MKNKTPFFVFVLALVVVGFAEFARRQYDELAVLRLTQVNETDLASARKRAFDAENKIKQLEAELELAKSLKEKSDEAVAAAAAAAAEATANNPFGPGGRGPGGRGNQLQSILLDNPQAVALQTRAQKLNISIQYAGFFRASALTNDQADQITTLIANRQNVMQDLMAAAQANGLQTSPQELQSLVAEQQSQIDAQLKALMGDAAYEQYQSYQTTLARRQEIATYQQQLTLAGVPLDAVQTEALVTALGPTMANGNRGGAGPQGRGRGGVSNISANSLAAASKILNPAQVQVLQATQQSQQANQALNQIMNPGGGRGGRGN